MVGPLLTNDKIDYTKSFYKYYKRSRQKEKITGWGRITELVMRPLLNMFFPELSVVIQPSAGQFAGRREILEKLSFCTGYGVEFALLIDIVGKFGLEKMAQVDLVKLTHRHRDIGDKGLMAFRILQVFCKKAEELGKMIVLDKKKELYRTVEYIKEDNVSNYKIKKSFPKEKYRPPMITIKGYRRKFNIIEYENGSQDKGQK